MEICVAKGPSLVFLVEFELENVLILRHHMYSDHRLLYGTTSIFHVY